MYTYKPYIIIIGDDYGLTTPSTNYRSFWRGVFRAAWNLDLSFETSILGFLKSSFKSWLHHWSVLILSPMPPPWSLAAAKPRVIWQWHSGTNWHRLYCKLAVQWVVVVVVVLIVVVVVLLAGWVTTLWLSRPLSVSQLSHPSLRGR